MTAFRGFYTDPNRAALERHRAALARIGEDQTHKAKRQARASLSPRDRARLEREEHQQALRTYQENQRRQAQTQAWLRAEQQRPDGFAWLTSTTDKEEEQH